jgi:transposase
VARLRKVPGIGLIGSHLFVAYLQDPHRFESPGQLIRYCRLGIHSQSSDGQPLGYERLDRSGHGSLKAISYRAWLAALRRGQGAVWEFYRQSQQRTGSALHARLNTQRKVLLTLWSLWRKGTEFDPNDFLASSPSGV